MSNLQHRSKVPAAVADALVDYQPLLQQLLFNRGITTAAAADRFLHPSYNTQLHDPFLLHDMEPAVERLLTAIAQEQMIVVFSDYDCDGIPGAVVMHDFLRAIGHSRFVNHIPHRHYDGFGLAKTTVEYLIKTHQPDLIITIDCGTSDMAALTYAAENGVDVIVTDHHEPKETLPPAVAIVNPKIGDSYPFTGLCGAAVVYKLVQATLQRGMFPLAEGKEKWWLDMVGIATVADMVPLIDENRVFAHYGLHVLRKTRRPGLQQLLRKQRTPQKTLTEDDVGFTIGPRINAASRMDTPEDAFHMLATTDESDAGVRVAHLEKLNTQRKTAVALMTKELHKRVAVVTELPPVLVFGNPDWRPSLVGLAANKLAEEYKRPVFLWGRDGNELFKGSCRSGGGVSVVRLMEEASHAFTEHGGHHMAGGFTVSSEYIHTVSQLLVAAHEALGSAALVEAVHDVEMTITLPMIDEEFIASQKRCAPFGCDNPKPLYLLEQATPVRVEQFGKQNEHTKLLFDHDGLVREAIAFFTLPHQFSRTPQIQQTFSLLVYVEESFFLGRRQVRLRIVDVL